MPSLKSRQITRTARRGGFRVWVIFLCARAAFCVFLRPSRPSVDPPLDRSSAAADTRPRNEMLPANTREADAPARSHVRAKCCCCPPSLWLRPHHTSKLYAYHTSCIYRTQQQHRSRHCLYAIQICGAFATFQAEFVRHLTPKKNHYHPAIPLPLGNAEQKSIHTHKHTVHKHTERLNTLR